MSQTSHQPVITSWSLSDEILRVTQRWYWVVLSCLLGAAAGWAVSMVWPSPYRATKELYVGINIYRAGDDSNAARFAGVEFVNANDYKNWQMASLNSLVYMDPILDETLAQLQEQDAYWQAISRLELAQMLDVYWRNAGKWRLVAEHAQPHRAAQAVLTWENVVIEHVETALAASNKLMALDQQQRSISDSRVQILEQTARFEEIRETLLRWQENLSSRDPALPVSIADVQGMQLALAFPEPSWQTFLDELPELEAKPGRTGSEYLRWLESALAAVDKEITSRQNLLQKLQLEQELLSEQYRQVSSDSLGLSTDLVVNRITDTKPIITPVRPTSTLILVGTALGLILWGIYWLVQIGARNNG